MDWLTGVEIGLVVLLVVAAIGIALFIFRRRWLSAKGGVVECGLRRTSGIRGSSWTLGIGSYESDSFDWYRVFSLSIRPKVSLARGATRIVAHRELDALETMMLFDDHASLEVESLDKDGADVHYELSMSPAALTGFMSWLEAAPPGGATYRA